MTRHCHNCGEEWTLTGLPAMPFRTDGPRQVFHQSCTRLANDRTVICRSAGVHVHGVSWRRLDFQNHKNQIKTKL